MIRKGVAPSKTLLLQMMELKDDLDYVTNRITSGRAVDQEDWELVRDGTKTLQKLFSKVEFDWESHRSSRSRDLSFQQWFKSGINADQTW